VRRNRRPLISILILFASISLAGCSLFTEYVSIPSDDCRPFLKVKDDHIDILQEELHYKSEKLRNCLGMVGE
jgi:hypothetical protein